MSAALTRFWWIVVAGVGVGLVTALWMIYELPSLTPRDKPVYTANARLFVTSAEGQYVRISVPRTVVPDTIDNTGRGGGGGPLVVNDPPDVQALLAAANVYPLLIESDEVARMREQMFGALAGDVTANAYSAVSTPQRYSPAQIPIIDIFATSETTKQATTLAQATADAFTKWIRLEQDRAGVEPDARILIKELRAPTGAFPSGGPTYGIPILVALAIMAAFGMIAVVLDQVFPRESTTRQLQSETS